MLRKVLVIFVSLVILVFATLTTTHADGPSIKLANGLFNSTATVVGYEQKYDQQ